MRCLTGPTAIFMLVLATASSAASILVGHPINWSRGDIGVAIAFAAWQFVYYAYPWAANGKTFAMALLGVQVVSRADRRIPRPVPAQAPADATVPGRAPAAATVRAQAPADATVPGQPVSPERVAAAPPGPPPTARSG
jgi:hypothetical protein